MQSNSTINYEQIIQLQAQQIEQLSAIIQHSLDDRRALAESLQREFSTSILNFFDNFMDMHHKELGKLNGRIDQLTQQLLRSSTTVLAVNSKHNPNTMFSSASKNVTDSDNAAATANARLNV